MAATTPDYGTSLFLAILPTADTILAQRASLANNNLIAGVRMLQNKRPEEAIPFFKRALVMDSSSIDAYNYLGNTYLQLKKNDDAIATFKKLVAMKPFDKDSAVNLGNAYSQAQKFADAEKMYKKAVSLSPNDKLSHYSLGQTYLLQNKLKDAETEFLKVNRIDSRDPNAYYALGQTYNKTGEYDKAIKNLKQAVNLKRGNFVLAETELGYAYAGKGDDYNLGRQITKLKSLDMTSAIELENATKKPQIKNIDFTPNNAFLPQLGPYTPLSILFLDPKDPTAPSPSSKKLTAVFQFNSKMDPVSIQTLSNWTITKASGGKGGYYNNGYTLYPQQEANLPILQNVTYSPSLKQATLTFSLTQNVAGDAVIDPSHLVFKFSGKDANGKTMDPKADQYDGFAGVAF